MRDPPGMELRHSALQLVGQVSPTKVNVAHGGLKTAVAGKGRDLMDVPACPRQIGKAKMA